MTLMTKKGVALSFLYIAFVRLLQLARLLRGGQQDLAIEVVMLPPRGCRLAPTGGASGASARRSSRAGLD